MTIQDKIVELKRKYSVGNIVSGSLYICPDGAILGVPSHTKIAQELYGEGFEQEPDEEYSETLYDLGFIRANTAVPTYVQLTVQTPTSAQYDALLLLFDFLHGTVEVEVPYQSKYYENRDSEELVKLIKRFYSSKTLYESLEGEGHED